MKRKAFILFMLFFVLNFAGCAGGEPEHEQPPANGPALTSQVNGTTPAPPSPAAEPAEEGDVCLLDVGVFPTLRVYLHEEYIHRDTWGGVTLTLTGADGTVYFEGLDARIRGRGNTSWGTPKRPFRVRFNRPIGLLDTGIVARDWTFIANFPDKSLLRNFSAYYLATLLGEAHDGLYLGPTHVFIDVYKNGEYFGVYMLSDQVNNVVPGRGGLLAHDDPTISEYMIETEEREDGPAFITIHGRNHEVRFPNDPSDGHLDYVWQYLTSAEDAMRERDWALITQYINVPSFVDFFMVQEVFKNQDVGFASIFMQIRGQGENRRLYMGPVWDFDISAGNCYYQGGDYGYRPYGFWARQNRWFNYLWRVPEFREAYIARWNEVRDNEIRRIIDNIEVMSRRYYTALTRNFERWPILQVYVWPNPSSLWRPQQVQSFRGQVDWLVDWLERRIEWLDAQYR